jgi:hypothetical protein
MTIEITQTFTPGFRLIDGSALNTLASQANAAWGLTPQAGITANAGGGRANAVVITGRIAEVATVASGNDSVVLPAAVASDTRFVINDGANALQVFANGTDTIDGTAGSTGVSLASGAKTQFVCYANGKWVSFKSA